MCHLPSLSISPDGQESRTRRPTKSRQTKIDNPLPLLDPRADVYSGTVYCGNFCPIDECPEQEQAGFELEGASGSGTKVSMLRGADPAIFGRTLWEGRQAVFACSAGNE
jgi:hypothetical protein